MLAQNQQYVTAATDFATIELLTEYGLERRHVLFFMDIGTREVICGGIAKDPNSAWTTQIARNVFDMWDGFLLGKRFPVYHSQNQFIEPLGNCDDKENSYKQHCQIWHKIYP